MRDYIDITGRTEEEAIRKGLEQLGLDRDEVSIEILERAKAGFLGFGSAPAKIRVSYGPDRPEPEPEPLPEPVQPEMPPEPEKRRCKKPPEPSVEPQETPAPRRKRSAKAKGQERRNPAPEAPPVSAEEIHDEKATAIRAFLSGLLEHMDCAAEIRVYKPEEGRYKVILEGAGMGALIGRRGETLDAIQQLTNYSVNRGGARVRIQLDAEGYREKREQSLRNLARKEAAKVVKYRRSRTLEPMNAYERHVIHTALQDFPGVNTYSTGVDPNRRVVIAFDREKN
ncbi:MAG: protein jag [Oscillibacter sp.]|nr:protein jag [Oscillibacter sp.]